MRQSVFCAGLKYATCDERTRRALGQVNLDAPHIQHIGKAIEALSLKAEIPVYKRDCWAHVGIPSHKIAIYCRDFMETARIKNAREKWEANGWRMLAVTVRSIENLTVEQLADQLKAALRELGKTK